MIVYFVRWPMEIEAGIGDEHSICSHCEDDWASLDDPNPAVIERTRQQRRCPVCGLWIDRPEATNAV
jgi:hypothetical protein